MATIGKSAVLIIALVASLPGVVVSHNDNCCGIDRQCTTEQDWTDGYWAYQNEECAGSTQTQPLVPPTNITTSNIDNCCFVDRQCDTSQDWDAGYWAYQNGQCAVPQQPQIQAQPVSASPSDIDNYCFTGWQCNNDSDWSRGYDAYQNNQCGGVYFTNSGAINLPLIEGEEWFKQRIVGAFEFLRNNSPKWFNYTVSKISRIVGMHDLTSRYGRKAFALAYAAQKKVEIDYNAVQKDDWPLHNVLVHEACHMHQWDGGKYDSWSWVLNWDKEPECYEIQAQALSEMLPGDRRINTLKCFAEYHPFESFCGLLRYTIFH